MTAHIYEQFPLTYFENLVYFIWGHFFSQLFIALVVLYHPPINTTPCTTPMKSDLIDRRIAELENELVKLRQRKVALLRDELNRLESDLGNKTLFKPSKGWATELASAPASPTPASSSNAGRKPGGRGKRLSEEEVVDRLRKVVAAAGSEGISARAAALQADVFYLRAIKAMDGAFVKTGAGKWTRYTIK